MTNGDGVRRWPEQGKLRGGIPVLAKTGLVVRLAIGTVFALSTGGKVRDPKGFARGVVDYQILPARLAYCVGLLVIPLEGVLAVSHLTGWGLSAAVPLALGLVASFGVAVGVNLGRRRALPCYCFGTLGEETISGRSLARLFLLMLGEGLLIADHSAPPSDGLHHQQIAGLQEIGLALFWAALLLIAAMWILSFEDLLNFVRRGGLRAARRIRKDVPLHRFLLC